MFPRAYLSFLAAILLGMTLVTVLGVKSFYERAALEDLVHPTAVGYDEYALLPSELTFETTLGMFGGRTIYPASLEPRELEADELVALSSGMGGEPLVFLRPEREDRPAQHYLQVGANQFLRVHQGAGDQHFEAGKPVGQE